MDPTSLKVLLSGSKKDDPIYVDDVFSTFLYEGNNSTNTITNGIDFAGEGGMLWVKARNNSSAEYHTIVDTERPIKSNQNGYPYLNSASANQEYESGLTSFNSDGFTWGFGNNQYNGSLDYVSWSFRKAPGFFDVVTYTGTGSTRTVAHNLGSVPGMIIIKVLDDSSPWWAVYHRSLGDQVIYLNEINAAGSAGDMWGSTTPTSTEFTVGNVTNVNSLGKNYVAYIFAHDDAQFGTNGDESIIKCGSYLGVGGGNSTTVDVGFEPQFLITKKATNTAGEWRINDVMRGIVTGGSDAQLNANTNGAELTGNQTCSLTPTGFISDGSQNDSATYIYMAIRRPNKPPESATEVFDMVKRSNTDPNLFSTALPYVDVAWNKIFSSSGSWHASSRLTVGSVDLDDDTLEDTSSSNVADIEYDFNNKINPGFPKSGGFDAVNYLFRRAPGFMDLLAYSGNGSNRQINHNLTVKPELIILRRRNTANRNWVVYTEALGAEFHLHLDNDHQANGTQHAYFNNTEPTSSVFTVGTNALTNHTNGTYIAYLFASLPGISKVGTYDGTGYAIDVDCGFTAGSRFVLIKRTDDPGDWFVFDTTRGINNGFETYLRINKDNAESSDGVFDYIDPLNSGFTITGSAPAALNASGGTYLFLAIA